MRKIAVKRFFTFLSVLMVIWQMPANAETPRELTWDHLVPAGPPIDDLRMELNLDQWIELELLASIRAKKKLGLVSDVDPQVEFGYELEHGLRKAGLDVEGLLHRYMKAEIEIRKRNAQVVKELDGQLVRIPGYALPLEFDGTSVEEFLLVPYVGACIHVPAPPKNQMVFVRLKQSFLAKTLYEPVWITGRMKIKDVTKSLNLIDGTADVHAGYTLEGVRVEPYTE